LRAFEFVREEPEKHRAIHIVDKNGAAEDADRIDVVHVAGHIDPLRIRHGDSLRKLIADRQGCASIGTDLAHFVSEMSLIPV
jgi:hypothetical protein